MFLQILPAVGAASYALPYIVNSPLLNTVASYAGYIPLVSMIAAPITSSLASIGTIALKGSLSVGFLASSYTIVI